MESEREKDWEKEEEKAKIRKSPTSVFFIYRAEASSLF
jgi:hypothetical protein